MNDLFSDLFDWNLHMFICISLSIISFSLFSEPLKTRTTEISGWWGITENFYIYQGCYWSCSLDDCEFDFHLLSCEFFRCIKLYADSITFHQENPARANGHIFNVGNPNNEVTVRQLAEMMTQVNRVITWLPLCFPLILLGVVACFSSAFQCGICPCISSVPFLA